MDSGHKELNVFFFGDSICFGQMVSVHLGWVTRIAEKLNEFSQQYNTDITITNSAVNGCTTRQALERMPYDIQSWKADFIIIQFGMNDCNYWKTDRGVPRVSPAGFAANLEEIISRARAFGINNIFLTTNHPSTRDQQIMPFTNITYQDSNRQYNEIIRKVAKNTQVTLVDVEKYWYEQLKKGFRLQNLTLSDGVHLSVPGHDLYFDFFYPLIEDGVKRVLHVESPEEK